jgi:hypothetical protein
MNWQPITTAPRDGQLVLAFSRLGYHAIVSWRAVVALPDGVWEAEDGSWIDDPTHWMPLPEPPQSK